MKMLYVIFSISLLMPHSIMKGSFEEPLLGKVPIVNTKNSPNEINVLAYNIQFLGVPGKDAPGIIERSKIIADYVKDFDVVVFCEAFESDGRTNLLSGLAKNGFKYSTYVLGAGLHEKKISNQKLGHEYDQPGLLDMQDKQFFKEPYKHAGTGTRKFIVTQFADAGIKIAEFGAKAIDAIAGLFGKKTKLQKKIENIEEDVGQIMHDGGVFIVSKYPITQTKEYIYEAPPMGIVNDHYLKPTHFDIKKAFGAETNWDWFANKGVLYAKVVKDGRPYHIFGTHTQALYKGVGDGMREKLTKVIKSQCDQMAKFIKNRNIPANEPVVMAGDFNINEFKPNDEKYPNKDIFNYMQKALNAYIPTLEGVQCETGNDINPKNIATSPCNASRIDYVMANKNFAQVKESFNKFIFMRTPTPWDKDGRHSLSDHEAMYGYFKFEK